MNERKTLDVILINPYQFIGISNNDKRALSFPETSVDNYKYFLRHLPNLVTLVELLVGDAAPRTVREVCLEVQQAYLERMEVKITRLFCTEQGRALILIKFRSSGRMWHICSGHYNSSAAISATSNAPAYIKALEDDLYDTNVKLRFLFFCFCASGQGCLVSCGGELKD